MNCRHCESPLKPHYRIQWEQYEQEYGDGRTKTCLRETGREFVGYGYEGTGLFCSVFCGYGFGVKRAQEAVA